MAELAALNVKLTGDATGLRAALQSAEGGLERVATQARQTTQQTAAVSTGMGRLGAAFGRHSYAISNVANQFSDLAVQIGAGVPASRALSQQLPQMTAMMGPLATVIGVTSGVLIGLGGSFLTAAGNARTYQSAIDDLEAFTSRIDAANNILSMSLYELAERYGTAASRVRELAQEELELAAIQAQRSFSEQVEALSSLDSAYRGALRSGRDYRNAMQRIEEDFGLTGQAAQNLAQALNNVATAATPEEQVSSMEELRAILEQNNIELSQIPDELQDAIAKANALETAMINVAAASNSAAEGARNFSMALPMTMGGIGPGLYNADGSVALPPGAPAEGGGVAVGCGGGRGVSLSDQIQADLETLRAGFMTQEELQIAAYASQQELLQQALEQRLITQQEYNDLMEQAQQEHARAMSAIDVYRYGSGVAQAQQFMGDMASAFASGNEEMMRIGKAFGAAEALINAWRTYSQVMADPSLPWFAKIPAAVSLLGSAMRAVSAIQGVGKGGSGQRSAGGGTSVGAGATAGGMVAGGGTSRNVAIQLTGGDMFSRDQVIRLINGINEAVEDGAIVRLA